MGEAFGNQRPQNPTQEDQAKHGGSAGQGDGNGIDDTTPLIQRCGKRTHRLPSLRARFDNIRRASASTTKVTMNNTKPSSSKAAR